MRDSQQRTLSDLAGCDSMSEDVFSKSQFEDVSSKVLLIHKNSKRRCLGKIDVVAAPCEGGFNLLSVHSMLSAAQEITRK